jgi:ABC-type sugar transport system substrate-binding protein
MAVLLLAGGIAVLAVVALLVSRQARGRRRLLTQRVSIYTALPSVTAVLVLLPLQLQLSFADALSLAGLVLSLAFGMGARTLERMTSRLRIGVVIPSRSPFHFELRQGLKAGLSSVRLDINDDYITTTQAAERLSEFVPSLRRTLDMAPDYLVIHSPSVQLVSTAQVIGLLRDFIRRGGGIVFIDNQPTTDARAKLGKHHGRVISDVETGAKIIAEHVQRNMNRDDEILVLAGPPGSAPAIMRQKILEEALPGADIQVADTGGWTRESAYAAAMRCFRSGGHPRFIICGNDVMAAGAVRAIREHRRTVQSRDPILTEVIGYDGIARALFAIAEDSPLAATVCTPPSAYGHEIAAMILADARRVFQVKSELLDCCIPVGEGQLITRYNVELVLDG